ncbi:MAG: CCA tRNA nucleotidyltransferase, partial [Planctomycetota bacterium]
LGARFGCIQVHPEHGVHIEVTTFRTEGAYRDGRRPEDVSFGTDPSEDAHRRDFTVNALFEDAETGEILDYVDGLPDFRARLVRAVGDPHERFAEDRLRMLRAVRLAARLGWRIHPDTRAAIRAHADAIKGVSPERIREELLKILRGGGAARGLDLLHQCRLLRHVLPEVAACEGVPQPPEFHPEGDVLQHTQLLLAGLDLLEEPPSLVLALGALLHDVGKPPTFKVADRIRFDGHDAVGAQMAEDICRRLHCSRKQTEDVRSLVARHMQFRNIPDMREAKRRRFLEDPLFPEHLALHRLDCLAAHGDLGIHDLCVSERERYASEPPRPIRLLGGRDLMDLGLEPGPQFAKILRSVEDAVLEGRLETREQALEWVREHHLAPDGGKEAVSSSDEEAEEE